MHRSKGTTHRSLQFKKDDDEEKQEDYDHDHDDEGVTESAAGRARYMDEFPSGRRCATTQHRFGHRGRDAHTSVSRGAGGVARAYMHIHTAAKCHTHRCRARIYTRTQRHSHRRVAPPCGQAEAGDDVKGEQKGRSEEWGMRKMGAERSVPRGNFAVELSFNARLAVYHLPGTYEIHPS